MTHFTIKYNKPKTDDTCIVMCFFSPVGFKKPLQNIRYNLACLKEAQIPYVVIELLYEGQTQNIPESIVVKSKSIIFSKENLWNIGEKYVPQKYSKILFLDSDILFNKPDWFDSVSKLLDHNDIIQPMEYACRDIDFHNLYNKDITIDIENIDFCKHAITKAIKHNHQINLRIYQPGFGIGIKRDFFNKIHGFFEHGITGASDVLFWLSIIDFNTQECENLLNVIPIARTLFNEYRTNMRNHISISKIDYLIDSIGLHLYHGNNYNRFYGTRNKYIPSDIIFYRNKYGVLEIESNKSGDMITYWIDRKEDE